MSKKDGRTSHRRTEDGTRLKAGSASVPEGGMTAKDGMTTEPEDGTGRLATLARMTMTTEDVMMKDVTMRDVTREDLTLTKPASMEDVTMKQGGVTTAREDGTRTSTMTRSRAV